MSDPRAAAHWPAATAAAEPPDDPPGTRSVSQGFLVACSGSCEQQQLQSALSCNLLHLARLVMPTGLSFPLHTGGCLHLHASSVGHNYLVP